MAANHPAKNTNLVRALRARLGKEKDWPVLYKALKEVYDNPPLRGHAFSFHEICSAFVWVNTIQGHMFWSEWNRRSFSLKTPY